MMNRRVFLKSAALACVAGGLVPGVFVRMARAGTREGRSTLVVVFQRGAVDGLNVVVPHGDPDYYRLRPGIAIPRPRGGDDAAIDLDGFFGLHPALEPLAGYWRDRSLAFVHASGSPDATRSHFDAQDFMEAGTPGVKSTRDGFLARALDGAGGASSPLRAVSMTQVMPRIFAGSPEAVAMPNIDRFGIRGAASRGAASASFEAMYDGAVAGSLSDTAHDSFEAMRILEKTDPASLPVANGAQYPAGGLGASLRQIAQLIKADVGLEVAFTDVGGWDTHANQGGARGQLANQLRGWGDAIAAFAQDLGSRMGDVTLVSVSEFGRTAKENGNRGTDHGHGNVMTIIGGGVRGGRVYGRWPGLGQSKLHEGRDLAVTTDFRAVFGEILSARLGVDDLASVFPGFDATRAGRLGLAS